MQIIFDVLGSPSGSGGPYLHASQLVGTWLRIFPEDNVKIVGPRSFARELLLTTSGTSTVQLIRWSNRHMIFRVIGQLAAVPVIVRRYRRSSLISTVPVISPLAPRSRSYCFAHDWRHLTHREEFGSLQRQYRRVWLASVRRSRVVFCISVKALEETAKVAPSATLLLAQNGADHAGSWARGGSGRVGSADKTIITFGHRRNKRPELVIRAIAKLPDCARAAIRLVILGATGEYRQEVQDLSRQLQVDSQCSFPGFVSEQALHDLMLECDLVILASSDEGFGLPVAEALFLGKPAIATTDGGLESIYGGRVLMVEAAADAMAAGIRAALSGEWVPQAAPMPSWEACVRAVRAGLGTCMALDAAPRIVALP